MSEIKPDNGAEICKKVIDGTASPQDAKAVVDWFSSSIEGQQYLSEMIDRDAYFLENESVPDISLHKSQFILSKINKTIQEKRLKRVLLRVAAALIPFVLLLGFGIYINSQTGLFSARVYTEIFVPNGERARIVFQDGSEVHLNSGTRMRYPKKFGLRSRNVYLQGEAYFNVVSNRRRPFVVRSGNTSITVLGTSFNVNAYEESDKISIMLDKGAIRFSTPMNSYSISSGQEIVYNRVTGESRITMPARPSNKSLWKSNVLYMNNLSLADVLTLLERRFDVRFEVIDSRALIYSYTLITRRQTVESVLEEMQKIAPVRFRRVEDVIEVSVWEN